MTRPHVGAARRGLLAGLLGVFLLVPGSTAQVLDDAELFTVVVPPNVQLLLDTSASMNHVVWHPAFDPSVIPTDCTVFDNSDSVWYEIANDTDLSKREIKAATHTYCGNTREIFKDTNTGSFATRWDGTYLNWYFSDAADAYVAEIVATNNGTTSECNGSKKFAKYRRARMTALQQVMLDVMCEVNEGRDKDDGLRFGMAQFRNPVVVWRDGRYVFEATGGYVSEGIDDNTPEHANDMEAQMGNLRGNTQTPLSEALFQIYTYFMSRDEADRPVGVDGVTKFPEYAYEVGSDGVGGENNPAKAPPDPVQFHCQKNFVILVTDGEPTFDDFYPYVDPTDTALGFSDFANLIGNYNGDSEDEFPSGCFPSRHCSRFLDDIAKFMRDHDFRPDLPNDQVIDTYTVGFRTSQFANDLLQKTADVGNGLFFRADDADALKDALIQAMLDIVEKTQSFTASTVPASRTVEGADFYTSFFLPLGADPFWQGHLQAYHITAAGDILDKDGVCALDDPNAPAECNSGPFLPNAEPFWDAGEEIPSTTARNLVTHKLSGGTPSTVAFDVGLTWEDLDLERFDADGDATTPAPNRNYPGSNALNEEGLADEIIQYIRGCKFGTGVNTSDVDSTTVKPCERRDWLLADIFHSNPLVVANPRAFILEESYQNFKNDPNHAERDRVIFGGSNGGFLHGFNAGEWDSDAGAYTEGTGEELFGFMPWYVRNRIKLQAVPNSAAEHYFVDGQISAADVWEHPNPTSTTKAASEWLTMLVSGLRQGGRTYFALDITDPASAGYPGFLWEFPREDDPDDLSQPGSFLPLMGQTWGEPVLTRIRVQVGGDDNGGQGYERWVVIVTAGYDPSGDPNLPAFDPDGKRGRAVFVLEAKSGRVLAMERVDTAVRSDATVTNQQESYALAGGPAVLDLDFDGYADLVYLTDVGGNVWKWVLDGLAEDRVNDNSGRFDQPSWTFRKFFEAPTGKDGPTVLYKSFFFPPSATMIRSKLYLAFGSGERTNLGFEGPTNSDDDNNRFYVATDLDPFERKLTPFPVLTEAELSDVTDDESCQAVTNRGFFLVGANGEKFVTNSEIFARNVIAASFTPTDLTDPCETGGGRATLYVFDVLCSEGFFGDPATPSRTLSLDKGFPTDPRVSAGVDGKKNRVFIEKSRAEIESIDAGDLPSTGSLLYWRELR